MAQQQQTNKLLLRSGLAVLGIGLVYWLYNQYNLFTKYCYKIKDIKFNTIGLNKTNVTIFMLFRNFSSIKSTITQLDLSIYLNDKLISKVLNNYKNVIEANSTSEVVFDVEFSITDLFKTRAGEAIQLLADISKDKSKVVFRFEGTASIKVGMFNFRKVPIKTSMSLKELLESDPNAFVCDI